MANDAKVNLIAGVTKNLTSKVKAGELVNFVASQVVAKGRSSDMAQAGGDQPENLGQALIRLTLGYKISYNYFCV